MTIKFLLSVKNYFLKKITYLLPVFGLLMPYRNVAQRLVKTGESPKPGEKSRQTDITLFNSHTMKKITALFALLTLTLGLVFVACKKDENEIDVQSLSYANPENPYDMVGVKHNEGLKILHEKNPANNMNAEKSLSVLAENGFEKLDFSTLSEDFTTILSAKNPLTAVAEKKWKAGKISEKLNRAIITLNDIIQKNCYTPQLAQEIKNYEASVAKLQLSNEETRILYNVTSVARFSNAYWMEQDKAVERAIPRKDYVMLCDVAGGLGAASSGGGILLVAEAAALASELGGNLWDWVNGIVVPNNPGGPIGWGWGGGIYGPPCNPGYACPCTIEFTEQLSNDFYMTGFGAAVSDDLVTLVMDGHALDPGFRQIFSTGVYNQEYEFTMPQDIVNGVYAASGLPAPQEPGVSPAGPKQVVESDGASSLILPIPYFDGIRIYIIIIVF